MSFYCVLVQLGLVRPGYFCNRILSEILVVFDVQRLKMFTKIYKMQNIFAGSFLVLYCTLVEIVYEYDAEIFEEIMSLMYGIKMPMS